MGNLLNEPRISFAALARREGCHVATVWRWSMRGIKGHRLESLQIGGKRFTTLPAYHRWIAAINGDAVPSLSSIDGQQQARQLLLDAGLISDTSETTARDAAANTHKSRKRRNRRC